MCRPIMDGPTGTTHGTEELGSCALMGMPARPAHEGPHHMILLQPYRTRVWLARNLGSQRNRFADGDIFTV